MPISTRALQLRNVLVSLFNGVITLIILLIAPLGLAAVIANTLLITVATYAVSSLADLVISWLHPTAQAELLSESNRNLTNLHRHSSLEQRRRQ